MCQHRPAGTLFIKCLRPVRLPRAGKDILVVRCAVVILPVAELPTWAGASAPAPAVAPVPALSPCGVCAGALSARCVVVGRRGAKARGSGGRPGPHTCRFLHDSEPSKQVPLLALMRISRVCAHRCSVSSRSLRGSRTGRASHDSRPFRRQRLDGERKEGGSLKHQVEQHSNSL